jgi:hypothetical protein
MVAMFPINRVAATNEAVAFFAPTSFNMLKDVDDEDALGWLANPETSETQRSAKAAEKDVLNIILYCRCYREKVLLVAVTANGFETAFWNRG